MFAAKEVEFHFESEVVFHLVGLLVVGVSAGLACLGLWKGLGLKGRLLPLQRDAVGRWSGLEVLLVFVIFVSTPLLVLLVFRQVGFYDQIYGKLPSVTRQQLWIWPLAAPLTVASTYLALHMDSRTRPADYGMSRTRIGPNIALGYLSWLVLTPLLLAIFFLALQWISAGEHPLSELAREEQAPQGYLNGIEWALIVFQAVIAAPFLEELLFRGILLGWLRRATLPGHLFVAAMAVLFAGLAGEPSEADARGGADEFNWEPLAFTLALALAYLGFVVRSMWGQVTLAPLPYDASSTPESAIQSSEQRQHVMSETPAENIERERASPAERDWFDSLAPIWGSSLLFAAFHARVWPSPIPLFALALGLGWLAYRTHSLVGSITAHMLFNAVACIVMILGVLYT